MTDVMVRTDEGVSVSSSTSERGAEDDAIRILLVDDHTLMRSALRLLLESLGHVVRDASSAEDALRIAETEHIDVALMDVRMPGNDGLWGLREMRRRAADVPVVMLSFFADEDIVREAISCGAAGYVLKDAAVHQFVDSIATALRGDGLYLHPLAAECLVTKRPSGGADLTARELDVLRLLVQGSTNEEIANELFITEKTVKSHLSGVYRKLGVTNRTQAATRALRDGLVVAPHDDAAARDT